MILQVLILLALSDSCQAWWSKCDKYENRHEFCAVLFSKEDCRGDAMVLPSLSAHTVHIINNYLLDSN